jgi:hypothetical protein
VRVGYKKGACASWGFLAKYSHRVHTPAPTFFEIDNQEREAGAAFRHLPSTHQGLVVTKASCFRQLLSLQLEMDATEENSTELVKVLTKDRDCPKWYPYTAGFSPKEHLEEYRVQELERDIGALTIKTGTVRLHRRHVSLAFDLT